MEQTERPKSLRTILLALPVRRKLTKKYTPPVYVPGTVETGVRPGAVRGEPKDNWRLNQLSKQISRKQAQKWVYIPEEGVGSGVSAATLAGSGTSRSNDLSKPKVRYLEMNKKQFSFLGKRFTNNMEKAIKESWNTVYNYYKRQMQQILKKKREKRRKAREEAQKHKAAKKGVKIKSEKEIKEAKLQHLIEWCSSAAVPRKTPPPTPLPPRKIANLDELAEKISVLAIPRMVTRKYRRPSLDSTYIDPSRVSPAAQMYEPSDRIRELSKPAPFRTRVEYVPKPGAVKRSALTCKVSPRFDELAVPKKKAAEKDNDLKENPFSISPNALKYVATARIQELAKPTER